MGATATGKTDLAMHLSDLFPLQIVSVDSAMVYRGMDIGTAKPTRDQLAKYPHNLIDICDPTDAYSVGLFCNDVVAVIDDVFKNDKVPLLVGGTMQYFHRLQHGIASLPETDINIRQQVAQQIAELGLTAMHEKLRLVDAISADKIHPNDSQRIARALEVFYSSGTTMSDILNTQDNGHSKYSFKNIALWPEDRSKLHKRIACRFDIMLQQGLLDEVAGLLDRFDLTSQMPAMRSVGYKQVLDFMRGEYSKDSMRERAIIATRQLAKRQLTWLRSWDDVAKYSIESSGYMHDVISLVAKIGRW